jgi:C1A family cysteine protease
MFSANRPQKFTEKGLGWVPDSPDERDYDLYTEITKQYSDNDSKISLRRVRDILKSIDNRLPFEARQEVDRLSEDLEQFNFVKVNTYQVLSEKKKDRRVILLKFLMVYFYQKNIIFSRPEFASEEDDSSEKLKKISVIKATLRSRVKNNLKASIGKNKKDDRIDLEKDNFLVFLNEANRYWSWLNDEEYDFILRALVDGFQAWVNLSIEKVENKPGKDTKQYAIHADGIVGIQTYTWLREWLKVGPLEEDRLEEEKLDSDTELKSFRQAVFSRVPFSTSLPSDMLRAVFELLFVEEHRQRCQDQGEEEINKIGKEIGLRVEQFARENFFEIEPILSVITLIAGPVGSYPKTLGTALEIATKVFLSLFKYPKKYDDKTNLLLGASQDSKQKPPIYSLGQTIQLPDKDFIALEEEQKNLARLKELSKESVDLSVQRIKIYFKETFRRDLLAVKALVTKVNLKDSQSQELSESFKIELKKLCDSAYFLGKIYRVVAFLNSKSVTSTPDENKEKQPAQGTNGGLDKAPTDLEKASTDLENASNLIERIQNLNKKAEKLEGDPVTWFAEQTEADSKKENDFLVTFNALIELLDEHELDAQQPKATQENSRFKDLVTLELTDEHVGSVPISHSSGQTISTSDRLAVNSSGSPSNSEINQWLFPSYLVPGGADLLKNRKAARRRFESVEGKDNPPPPDIRTYTYLPQIVDLSLWCSPIYDQGSLQSCSAQAGAALVEYFARRYGGGNKDVSRRFLYKIARNLMGRTGDSGSSLRETIKAMALFGVPPENYWRYDTDNFDEEPTPFCYSFAQNYQALNYFRIDQPNIMGDELLTRIKIALAAGFPCTFGFTLHESIHDPFNVKRGYIPYPGKSECGLSKPDMPVGGHAALAVGYHDFKRIMKSNNPQEFSQGAFLIRNSWGTSWGLSGYGWLPYDYLLQGLTSDWWSLIKLEWLESGKFGLGGARSFGKCDRTKGAC